MSFIPATVSTKTDDNTPYKFTSRTELYRRENVVLRINSRIQPTTMRKRVENEWRIQRKNISFFHFNVIVCRCEADDFFALKNVKLFQRKTVFEWNSHEDIQLVYFPRIELIIPAAHWSQLSRRTIRNYVVLLHFIFPFEWRVCTSFHGIPRTTATERDMLRPQSDVQQSMSSFCFRNKFLGSEREQIELVIDARCRI